MSEHIRKVTVNGTRLSYVSTGSGSGTVIFVHGSLDDYRSWRYQMEPFCRHYRAIAYSRRYHYPNPWEGDGSDYSAELHAEDLAAFIGALSDAPVHLVTSSYGGNVGLYMTAQHPELVRSVVLGEPPLLPWLAHIPGGKRHWQRFLDEGWLPARAAFEQNRLEDGARLFLDGVMGRPVFAQLGRRGYQMIMDNAPEMKAETLANQYFPPFACEHAQALRQPVLLCKGELSPALFGMVTDDLAQCLPAARPPVVIPAASHAMHVANPDFYNRAVLEFLASC
jgi:non-heme chloroperoxidase